MNGPHPTSQHPNSKNLHHISIMIFVTNFPTTVSSKDLWKLCDRQGVVADVYIARKLSKSGRRFGFVRFIKNPDQANLLEDLNKIWIGSHHLFASIARFDRKQNSQPNQSHQKQSNNTKPHETGHASHTTGGRSYASVLNGKEGTQKPVLAGPITKNITLENSDLLELSDTSSVVLAKVRDVHLIINIYRVLKKEGFSDFKCKYMGGLWLWIEFSSDESRLKFQKNTEMELYFTQRKLVSHNFIPDERMIWIEIDGLPLNAWTTNAFKKIAGNWGETVFVDEDADENIANGRVCIKTKIKTHIMDSCLVSIKGVRYQVRVREFANWVPDFASLDNISQHDYESEASGNDQDIHSINESQEEGEINDKKEQMGYEMNAPGKSVDSFEEGEIIGESDDGCVKDCMGKKLDDDVEKDIEDCSNNVTEKCGVVNNNMSNNVEGEILEDHFDGDRGNDTIEDNADVNPSTNVSLEVNIPEVANDSSIVSPSTPPGNDLNIAKESCSTWLDYVGPLITDELDSEKRWSYRDPKGNIQGSFSLAQLHMWKDYFPSDLQIWSYYGNVKETILLHNALKRRTKNAEPISSLFYMDDSLPQWRIFNVTKNCLLCLNDVVICCFTLYNQNDSKKCFSKTQLVYLLSFQGEKQHIKEKLSVAERTAKAKTKAQLKLAEYIADIMISEVTLRRNSVMQKRYENQVGTKLTQSSLDFSFRRKPRGGIEQEQYEALLVQVQDVNLVPVSDRWKWSLENSGDFSVASVRKMLDDKMLPDVTTKTRWIKLVPIKVNVHAWKVKIDSLPTRFNISRRGMDIESITCSICDNEVESSSHLFFKCNMVRDIIRKITRWWDITYIEADSYEDWLNWLVNLRLSSNYKQALEGVFYVMWWHVWQYRNKYIFEAVSSPKAMIFEDIVSRSFYWCRNRCKASFSWNDWLKNPYLVAL
ncbi:RNA-directed DNA polymerase, eukaryota [Tanacetum coccineum]